MVTGASFWLNQQLVGVLIGREATRDHSLSVLRQDEELRPLELVFEPGAVAQLRVENATEIAALLHHYVLVERPEVGAFWKEAWSLVWIGDFVTFAETCPRHGDREPCQRPSPHWPPPGD